MKLLIVSIVTTSAALAASPATAQSQPQQPTQTAPSTNPKATASDPVICEKEEIIGSRLATHKICMTRSQWEDARSQDRMNLEKTQTQRGMEASGKGG